MNADPALKAELLALEERLLDPTVRAVPGEVRALLAPEFIEFGASGRVFDRDAILAMLAKVGIVAKIENVEWAQWLSGAFKGNFDLTIINHVEPLDYMQYANPDYYWGYNSKAFNALAKQRAEAGRGKQQIALYGDIQRLLATDAVNAFLFNPSQVSVCKRGLKGLWASSPVFANDLSQVSWQ